MGVRGARSGALSQIEHHIAAAIYVIFISFGLLANCSDDVCWEEVYLSERNDEFLDIWGSYEDDVFAVGWSHFAHYDGVTWEEGSEQYVCNGIWGISDREVYAACISSILKFDGDEWHDTGAEFHGKPTDIWGSPSGDIFVVGYYQEHTPGPSESVIVKYDGEQWTEMQVDCAADLESVWGTSSDNVYAVGHVGALGGVILHYDGNNWSTELEHLPSGLYAVWGSSESNVFAVGGGGYILHFNGNDWEAIESGKVGSLDAVWGVEEDAVYIGGSGILLLYTGGAVHDIREIRYIGANSIWGTSTEDVFVAGCKQEEDSNPIAITTKAFSAGTEVGLCAQRKPR